MRFALAHLFTIQLFFAFIFTVEISQAAPNKLNQKAVGISGTGRPEISNSNIAKNKKSTTPNEIELQKQIEKASVERSAIEDEKANLEAAQMLANQRLNDISKELVQTKRYLQERIKALYKFGKNPELQFLITNEPLDMIRNLKILKLITKRDLYLIRDFRNLIDEIRNKRNLQASRRIEVANLEKDLRIKETRLNIALERLSQLRLNPFLAKKGQLNWPINGELKLPYGLQASVDGDHVLFQRGVVLASKRGTRVLAVAEGVLVAQEFIQGFGVTGIIDHGDHFYSVYSGLDQIRVSVGDRVKEGELLGTSGYLVNNEIEGLYFEMRHYAQSMDPAKWMIATSTQSSLPSESTTKEKSVEKSL